MWATIPSRSRAGRSGWGSSGSRCSSTASTTCGSSSTTTCASCDSSHDDAHATGLGRTEPRRAFLRPPMEWAGPAAPVTMKIPYKWLQEFVDLRLSPAEAAGRLTNAGIEVAAVTPLAPDVRGVVVGEIEAIERELGESHGHRLLLCRVSTGSQKFSVICGAPNTKVGVRAAFAPPGAVLPGQRRVETATIRGVPSQGMRSEEHTSELQSLAYLVCRLLLEKKKKMNAANIVRLLRSTSSNSLTHIVIVLRNHPKQNSSHYDPQR